MPVIVEPRCILHMISETQQKKYPSGNFERLLSNFVSDSAVPMPTIIADPPTLLHHFALPSGRGPKRADLAVKGEAFFSHFISLDGLSMKRANGYVLYKNPFA